MRTLMILALLVSVASCRPRNLEEEAGAEPEPPPAAALAGAADTLTLQHQLAQLEALLAPAEESSDKATIESLAVQAEAVTDRLLETRIPFAQLANGYSVESRVRQLQSLADRVIARIRRDNGDPLIGDDIRLLRASVASLRQEMSHGGGPARPPVDSLLAAAGASRILGDAAPGSSEGGAQAPRLLGDPINRDDPGN
ncbi:MAG: hypothetical protein ACRELD_06485 [Longimicrobiales bacterium]